LLRRDTSPKSKELRDAWDKLRQKIEPIAVVFDVGGVARDNEHIHSVAVRQIQRRLGYCSTDPSVADFELKLERDGEWSRFEKIAAEALGHPWIELKDKALAEDEFSLVMSQMFPELYTDPMSWFTSRAGTHTRSESPEEAASAIRDMLKFRKPNSTLFLVVDEVSQYVLSSKDRVDRLRAFVTSLGAGLKGKVWLLALGQQKLDEEADDTFLVWAKDRFPPKLRVHLAATNIRDVVHKRMLQKTPEAEADLRRLFETHRPDLKLYAYGCESITPDEFVDVYPMLPGHIELLLQITSALRIRSSRAQGDDQAIRGLLQLLGELFREQNLAELPVGSLITLDQVYEVQHTALDSDAQASMARILSSCSDAKSELMVRTAKVVALLELIQDTLPTDATLVSQCLFDRLDRGNQLPLVTEALEELRQKNLLGYSEKTGYKLQSSSAEEWERERRDVGVARDTISDIVQEGLKLLLASPERPRLSGRPFPWAGLYSDGRQSVDAVLTDPRQDATVRVDFRFVSTKENSENKWVKLSAESSLINRLIWVAGDCDYLEHLCRELHRSRSMVRKYKPRRESLNAARKVLLTQEENRAEDMETTVRDTIAAAWMSGSMYFRARSIDPQEHGSSFANSLHTVATRILPDLFPHFLATEIQPSELLQLIDVELSGPSPKFLTGDLGILELDSGRYVPACSGVVPKRVQEHIENEGGIAGTALLANFGGPPYGYTPNVVKSCVAGLLRGGKVRIEPEGSVEITAVRDAGVRDLFEKDRTFRRATLFPCGDDDIGFQARVRICKFFESQLEHLMDREDHAIADAVALHFPNLADRLRLVLGQLNKLPGAPETPSELAKLGDILEQCVRCCRQTKPTVKLVKRHLDALRDGVEVMRTYEAELSDHALQSVCDAAAVTKYELAQLREIDCVFDADVEDAATRVETHLRTDRPWRDVDALTPDVLLLRQCYQTERQHLLEWQELLAEQARVRVMGRDGISTLTADQLHMILRPMASVITDTTSEAIAPPLRSLKESFEITVERAEDEANDRLDRILSEGKNPLIVRIDLSLKNRELKSESDVEALLDEIRERLLEQVRSGAHIRLV
jgi:hypothetical protein